MLLLLKRLSFKRSQTGLGVTVLMALSILVSQMFSTILISDVNINIPGEIVSETVFYGRNTSKATIWTFDPSSDMSPLEYPLMAENAIDPLFDKGNQSSPGISDSGGAFRAFFHLKSQDRLSIGSYSGPASVAELRYLCFPPELSYDNATYTTFNGYIPPAYIIYLKGRLRQASQ